MKIKLAILLLLSVKTFSQSDKVTGLLQKGNAWYKQNQAARAEAEYRKAIDAEPGNEIARFNLGNALYKQNKQVDAAQVYLSITNSSSDKDLLAKTYYNQGVILSRQKNTEQSIEAYKKALRINPSDNEARENLQKALLELKKKKQPEKKEDRKKKKPDQQKEKQSSKMDPRQAEQRLRLLEQKEKEVQQRVQKDKAKEGGSKAKDW